MTDTSASTEEVTLTADHFCCTQFQKMDEQVNIIHLFVKVKLVTIQSFIEIKQIKYEHNLKEASRCEALQSSPMCQAWSAAGHH